jgi:hypothetical protein
MAVQMQEDQVWLQRNRESREGIMEAVIDFAAVGGAIVLSLGIALSLEWFALHTLINLMPRQAAILATEPETLPAGRPELVAPMSIDRKRAA